MSTARKPAALATFSPTLFQIWREALTSSGDQPYLIRLGSEKRNAQRARLRLYSLRKSLDYYGHDLAAQIVHLRIALKQDTADKSYWLEIKPMDSDIDAILSSQVDMSQAPDPADLLKESIDLDAAKDLEHLDAYLNPKPTVRR